MKKIVHFTKAQLFTWPGTNREYADVNLMEFETQNTIYRFKAV